VSDWTSLAFEALPKALLYVALQLAVGTASVHWLIAADRRSAVAPQASAAAVERWLAKLALTTSLFVLAALMLRVVGHTTTAFGFFDLTFGNLWIVGGESRWGLAWQRQVLAASGLVAAGAIVMFGSAGWTWIAYAGAAALCCAALPLLGHGAGSLPRGALHAVHIAASGAWIGTLALLTLLALKSHSSEVAGLTDRLVASFHLVALPATGLLTATGAIVAVLYVGVLANLWTTTYGRMLMVKLAAVSAAALCGWRNWRRARGGQPLHLPTLLTELTCASIVVVVTSVLTEIEHP
jgi:copper transport protein